MHSHFVIVLSQEVVDRFIYILYVALMKNGGYFSDMLNHQRGLECLNGLLQIRQQWKGSDWPVYSHRTIFIYLKKKKFLFINSEVHLSYTCKQNLQREDSACRLCEDIYLHAVQNSQTLLVEKKSLQKIP